MNTNHALQLGLRSLILIALTSVAAACGAAPEGQTTVDEKSATDPAGEALDPDASAPSGEATPAPSPSLPIQFGRVPEAPGGGGPVKGGTVPSRAPVGGRTAQ